jgi:branched-chain amino acid transport system ATP-binding protein
MRDLLTISQLDAFYGDFQALFNVSLRVGEGEVVAIVGSNGAGKSTLLKCIAGQIATRNNAISFDGAPIGSERTHLLLRRGISLVPEGRRLFPSLSVEENLLIGGEHGRKGPWTLARVYDLFPVLKERRNQRSTSLSGGQQQMVAIGRALMAGPSLLLLDEPSLGLAPSIVLDMFAAITQINQQGTAVLLVEQNVSMALETADRAYVMEEGRIVAEGQAKEMMDRPEIRKAYLGLDTH